METIKALEVAEALLKPYAESITHPEPKRMDLVVCLEQFKPAVKQLVDAHWGYLAAITGVDHPAPAVEPPAEPNDGSLEILYSFCRAAALINLRISVPNSCAVVPTVCDLIPSATLYERELLEMFGIEITGTPNRERLLLPDDWPDNVYPLRKSFTGLPKAPTA
jgi:Ni,Fe-hydrogenase III component G